MNTLTITTNPKTLEVQAPEKRVLEIEEFTPVSSPLEWNADPLVWNGDPIIFTAA